MSAYQSEKLLFRFNFVFVLLNRKRIDTESSFILSFHLFWFDFFKLCTDNSILIAFSSFKLSSYYDFQLPLQITTRIILFPHLPSFFIFVSDLSDTLLASIVYQGDFHSISHGTSFFVIHCQESRRNKEQTKRREGKKLNRQKDSTKMLSASKNKIIIMEKQRNDIVCSQFLFSNPIMNGKVAVSVAIDK